MGNCQAVDAAVLVIQHPSGKVERMYWPVMASEVMRTNPGHYVSLIIPLPENPSDHRGGTKTMRFTSVKLLRPTDTLVLGHAYRLVTTQEVVKVLRAKKHAKMQMVSVSSNRSMGSVAADGKRTTEMKHHQASRHDQKHRQRPRSTNLGAGRPKTWRPSLQSISESAS